MANSLLQKAATSFAASSSQQPLAYSGNVSSGSLLVAVIPTFNLGATVSVLDTLNGNWTKATPYFSAGANNRDGSIWFFENSAAGACTVKVTPSISAMVTILIAEYSITSPTGVTIDTTNTSAGNGTAPALAMTVNNAGSLVVVGSVCNSNAPTAVSGGGFVFEQGIATNVFGGMADDMNAGSTETATFSPSPSNAWFMGGVVFKMAAGGGGNANIFLLKG